MHLPKQRAVALLLKAVLALAAQAEASGNSTDIKVMQQCGMLCQACPAAMPSALLSDTASVISNESAFGACLAPAKIVHL